MSSRNRRRPPRLPRPNRSISRTGGSSCCCSTRARCSRKRSSGRLLRARVHREAPDAGRSRRHRVGQLDAAHRPGLHGRSRDARGGARSLFGARRRGFEEGAALTGEETEADGFVADESEFNIFNTDRRLAAIEQLSDALAPIQQKKSIVYFSSGMTQRGEDNQVQLRAAIDRAVKANVSIYPVDTRGLTAVVPGGAASQSSGRGGTSMFSGRGVSRQFDSQAASQDTLVALAAIPAARRFSTRTTSAASTRKSSPIRPRIT